MNRIAPTSFRLLACVLFVAAGIPAKVAIGQTAKSVATVLDELDRWLGDERNGQRWREYLLSSEIRSEIERGDQADPAVLARSIGQYESGAKGLEKPQRPRPRPWKPLIR